MPHTIDGLTIRSLWTEFKPLVQAKKLAVQYVTHSSSYEIFALDGPVLYATTIFIGTLPSASDYNGDQAQNDADRTDFETNFQPIANQPITFGRRALDDTGRTKKLYDVQETVIYVGYAVNGTNAGSVGWTIKKVILVNGLPTSELWTLEDIAVWNNRLTETYT